MEEAVLAVSDFTGLIFTRHPRKTSRIQRSSPSKGGPANCVRAIENLFTSRVTGLINSRGECAPHRAVGRGANSLVDARG